MKLIVVGCFLLIALLTDLKYMKITNKLIIVMLVIGLMFNLLEKGLFGFVLFAANVFCGVMLLIIPFYFRQIGAGDVKLLAALSGVIGFKPTISVLIYCSIIGAIIALVFLILQKYNFTLISDKYKNKIPYALPIFLGYVSHIMMGDLVL